MSGGVLADAGLADLAEHTAAVEAAARAAGHTAGLRDAEQAIRAEADRMWMPGRTAHTAMVQAADVVAALAAAGQAPAPQPETAPNPAQWDRIADALTRELGHGSETQARRLTAVVVAVLAPQPETAPDAPAVVSDPGIRGGQPVIPGTRVPADEVAALIADGLTPTEVHELLPSVSPEAAARIAEPACTCSPPRTGAAIHDGACELARAATRARQLRYAAEGWYVPETEHRRPTPAAEPGTPDDARERLRAQYAAALETCRALIPAEQARAVLAVRDDALTTAQRAAETADRIAWQNLGHYRQTYSALMAAQQRIRSLEGTIHAAILQMGVSPESTSGTGSTELHAAYDLLRDAHRTALAPAPAQDGGAS